MPTAPLPILLVGSLDDWPSEGQFLNISNVFCVFYYCQSGTSKDTVDRFYESCADIRLRGAIELLLNMCVNIKLLPNIDVNKGVLIK